MKIPGVPPAELADLTRAEDRISFLYLERSVIHRDSNAITATDDRGVVHIPAASVGVLLLGPGTSITHQAIALLADHGATANWVGERGVRYYAHGRSLAASSRLLLAQAAAVSHRDRRLAVARTMYAMRFPGESTANHTMQQLRGKEGARVRRTYREHAQRSGVTWSHRDYDQAYFAAGDPINQALSAAHACLYGIVHAVIVALGAAPGLGFVHTGHERAFVYDIADLYKAEITSPSPSTWWPKARPTSARTPDGPYATVFTTARSLRAASATSGCCSSSRNPAVRLRTRIPSASGTTAVSNSAPGAITPTSGRWTSDDRHHPDRVSTWVAGVFDAVAVGADRRRVRRARQQPGARQAVDSGDRDGRRWPRSVGLSGPR